MFRRTFKVTYRPVRNNFVLLPDAYYKLVSTYDNGCLSLTFGNSQYAVSWAPLAGLIPDTTFGINARVAKEMGLKEDDLVKVSLIADVTNLKSVHVTPVSAKDWEIIDLSSEKIQETLLEQTRIINSTQVLLIWINKSMQVSLTVDRIRPNVQFGRIDYNTELIVTPNPYQQINGFGSSKTNTEQSLPPISNSPLSKSKTFTTSPASQSTLSRSSTLRDIVTIKRSPSLSKISNLEKLERLQKELKKENNRIFEFRVISGKWESDSQFSDVFLTKTNLPEFMDLGQCYVLKTATKTENNKEIDKEYYVNVKVIGENNKFPKNIYPTIELNENLMKLLKIQEFEKITLKPKLTIVNFIEKIELFSNRKENYKIIENSFKQYVLDNSKISPILLNQNQIVRLKDDLLVTVHLIPDHFKYCLINSEILKECKLYAADLIKKCDDLMDIDENGEKSIVSCKDLIKIRKFDEIIENICTQLKNDLCLDENNSVLRQGNILIAGKGNSGKTVIVERLIDKLGTKPFCCFYDIYYCIRSKGRKAETIQKDLRQIFTSCLNNAPSLVILENLDILAHISGEQQTQDNEYYNRIADAVQHLTVEFTTSNSIAVIATCNDVKYLNRRLYSPRGRHLFHTIVKIPDLEREDREIILENLCSHIDSKNLNYINLANLTEGYNIGDLVQFIERAIFYAYRINKSHPVLTEEHLNKSLENTNAYCLQGIKSYRKNKDSENALTVDKIPGLGNVVTVLEEVLMWPSKYPTIFNDSPLRNQAGVLLFGPPGTGKTFLVSQIAHSWNLRIISVKGPELLAKYIGQSEENVRNLFNRARSAKPCVLFFDEFDSLAPKRGHDSTGVTDRVVNQLLTELDGVEGLQGVVVIAASSRPELLDPALLRSGRIDRLVECSLPNQLARKKIFKALSQSINIDKLVDFNYFAEKSENYTGADIQSILTSANMAAIKEKLAECGAENLPDKIFVTQKHLMEAFSGTRPSLSLADINRYTKTYARFTNKEKPSRDFVAKRATLA